MAQLSQAKKSDTLHQSTNLKNLSEPMSKTRALINFILDTERKEDKTRVESVQLGKTLKRLR